MGYLRSDYVHYFHGYIHRILGVIIGMATANVLAGVVQNVMNILGLVPSSSPPGWPYVYSWGIVFLVFAPFDYLLNFCASTTRTILEEKEKKQQQKQQKQSDDPDHARLLLSLPRTSDARLNR